MTDTSGRERAPANGLPPYRTVPLSRSWDDGTQVERTRQFSQPSREDQRAIITIRKNFHNTLQAAEDVLRSPDAVAIPRLGITPPTVSSTNSPPRYMAYRNSLAGRLQSPDSALTGKASPRQPQQPLDPVMLSFDRSVGDGNNSSSDNDGDMHSSDGSDSLRTTNDLHAPPSNLQSRAFQYRIDDNQPIPYIDTNTGYHDQTTGAMEESSCVSASDATEPISNKKKSFAPCSLLSDGDSMGGSDEEETEDSPVGPARIYLEALQKKRDAHPRAPTPPRRFFGSTTPIPQNLLQDDDCESEQSSSFNNNPLQLSRSGEVIYDGDHESDVGSDLPPRGNSVLSKSPYEHAPSPVLRRRRRCGVGFVLLAILLMVALVLYLILVPREWKPKFMQNESKDPSPPLSQATGSPVPSSTAPTPLPTTRRPTSVPTAVSTILVDPPTLAPSFDPIRLERTTEAVNLLSSWGRFELWGDPETPQAQAFQWWIEDANWNNTTDGRKIQRYALAVLFLATKGHEGWWIESSGWMTDAHECSWFSSSVRPICSQGTGPTSELLILHLEMNGLRGTLPPEIALLESLTELRLVSGLIIGTIPAEWSRLTDLRVLELRDNMMAGGNLPSELASLRLLEVLDVSENRLGGTLPGWVSELSRLTFLILGGNGFFGPLPPEWSSLSQLRVLSLNSNRLTGFVVPPSYGQGLVQLRELHLSQNLFDSWNPTGWQEFQRLEALDLSMNSLEEAIPDTLYDLSSLSYLNLAQNLIIGELSDNIGDLESLEDLDLSYNRLEGKIPNSLGDGARNLRRLQLNNNEFTGALPGSFRRFRRIVLLRVDDNALDRVDNICRGSVQDTLVEFYADCLPEKGLSCSCCTHCCDASMCSEASGKR